MRIGMLCAGLGLLVGSAQAEQVQFEPLGGNFYISYEDAAGETVASIADFEETLPGAGSLSETDPDPAGDAVTTIAFDAAINDDGAFVNLRMSAARNTMNERSDAYVQGNLRMRVLEPLIYEIEVADTSSRLGVSFGGSRGGSLYVHNSINSVEPIVSGAARGTILPGDYNLGFFNVATFSGGDDKASGEFTVSFSAASSVPSPAALGPGVALLGLVAGRRRRGHAG